jgi:Leucine-rich repeat (LRR) protein
VLFEQLILAHNRIGDIPPFISALTRLQTLDLSDNLLHSLPRSLYKCADLGKLIIDGNEITSPPAFILQRSTAGIMRYLQQLCDAETTGIVQLEDLELMQLPEELAEIPNITTVNVSKNSLSSIRPLNLLTNITNLNLSENNLSDIDAELRYLTNLEVLNLAHNKIVQLSSSIRIMTSLIALNLSHNPMHSLPDGLWSLTKLDSLDTDGCDIRFPPSDVVSKGVKSLLTFQRMIERGRYTNRLDLSGIGFQHLTVPEDMWKDLRTLNVDRNYCSFLPDRLEESTQLIELRAVSNQLVRLPSVLGSLEQLQLLDVRNNLLQTLPESMGFLTALTRLRISGNRLQTLPSAWESLDQLTDLDAEENGLTTVPPTIFELTALKKLVLASNQLVQLPLSMAKATSLITLTLNSNALVRLPLGLRLLTQLKEFSAMGNDDIDLPPPSVVARGLPAIQSFLQKVHSTMQSRKLDISGYELMKIPDFVSSLTGLTSLTISGNQIDALGPCLPILDSLTGLYALQNKISFLPIEIGGSSSLKELKVDSEVWETAISQLHLNSSQGVRELFGRIIAAQSTGKFDLSGLGFQELPSTYDKVHIWHLVSEIQELNISKNAIQYLGPISSAAKLEKLDISSNKLKPQELDVSLTNMTNLTILNMSSNDLGAVPSCLRIMSRLKELYVSDCGLNSLAANLLSQNKELVHLDCRNNQLVEIKVGMFRHIFY